MWKKGSTPNTTSSAVWRRPGWRLALLEVGQQVAVGEHRRLGRAGRAAGEQQHRQVVVGRGRRAGRARRPAGRRAARASGRRARPSLTTTSVQGRARRPGRAGRRWPGRGGRRSRPGPRRRPAPLDLRCRAQRVERHGHGAGAEDGQVRHHEVPVVGGDDRHPVAGLDAQPDEPAPQAGDLVAQLAVGGRVPRRIRATASAGCGRR